MSRVLDTYMAMRFLKNLSTDFTEWDAYKLGLIDSAGKSIKKAKTAEEKEAVTPFMNLTRQIKRILSKVPGGKSFATSLTVGLFLLKEDCNLNNMDGDYIISLITKELSDIHLTERIKPHKCDTLLPGRYSLNSMFYKDEALIYIKEDINPIDNIFGVNIYAVTDIKKNIYYITLDDLKEL